MVCRRGSRDTVKALMPEVRAACAGQGDTVPKTSAILYGFAIAGLVIGSWSKSSAVANGSPQENSAKSDPAAKMVHAEMRNVMYHFDDKIAAHIRTLSGELEPIGGKDMPVFDDKNSFNLRIANAEIAMNTASLTNAFNAYVFASPKSPVKDVTMTISQGKLKVKGRLHDKGDIPFETDGELTPTPDGKLRMQADKIRALHVPVKGLMDLVRADLADFIKTEKVPGLSADGNGLIFDLKSILPPPHIEGAVTAVRIEGQNLILTFGTAAKSKGSRSESGNYMAYHGNQIRFGKLTMNGADLMIVDMDPSDPFDFYLDHYLQQLEAGYTKITGNFSLRVSMKDFDKLPRSRGRQANGQ
jgi:hypothetical protein